MSLKVETEYVKPTKRGGSEPQERFRCFGCARRRRVDEEMVVVKSSVNDKRVVLCDGCTLSLGRMLLDNFQ